MNDHGLVKEKSISEAMCECGVEIRAGSEFCYNCGEKVGGSTEAKPGIRTFEAAKNGSVRSRQRSRRIRPEPKTVEVVWRQSEGPGITLLLVSLAIALIAAVFVGVAMYLR